MKPRLICYSPGQSPLVFCWQDWDTPQRYVISGKYIGPTMIARWLERKDNRHFLEKGYEIHKIENRWTILNPVERVNEMTLRMDGSLYRYRIERECSEDQPLWSNSVRFEFRPSDTHEMLENVDLWWVLKNWSNQLQLTFFLRYESIWEQTRWTPGKKIKDKDTWPVLKHWPVTEFPDGDGYDWEKKDDRPPKERRLDRLSSCAQ